MLNFPIVLTRLATALLIGALAGALPTASAVAAVSKCDAGVTKAAGKKTACKANIHAKAYAKDTPPDAIALLRCEEKFEKACAKAKANADCGAQTLPCSTVETAVDTCVTDIIVNECGGTDGGFCWMLGAPSANCTDTCAAVDMIYDPATESYAGSGGTGANCAAVLDSLGAPAGMMFEQTCAASVACTFYTSDNSRRRCTTPGTEAATFSGGRRACACMVAP